MSLRNRLGKLSLAAFSTLLVLGCLELVGRFIYQRDQSLRAELSWVVKEPHREARDAETTEVGDFQLRDTIPEQALEDGVLRILFLGDSFTVGYGLEDNRQRFTDRIEQRLRDEGLPAGYRVDVFNAGMAGTAPDSWSKCLEDVLPLYRPHLVISVFFLRDGTPLSTSLRFHQITMELINSRYQSWPLYRQSRLLRVLYDRLAWRDFTMYYQLRLSLSYVGSKEDRLMWNKQQRHLRKIRDLCRDQGLPFQLIIFPMLFDLDHYSFFPVEAEIERFAREAEIPVFSLTPGFLGRDAASLWVAANDQHPNAEGHQIAADTLFPLVEELTRAARPGN